MKQLGKIKIALMHELYEKEIMDKAIDACDVTQEEVDHFLEYSENPIVYLSIHGNANQEEVESMRKLLIKLNCVVRSYEKGTKYDSYMVKNADAVIIFPARVGNLRVLGRGTETEAKIATEHNARLLMALEDDYAADILEIRKTSIAAGDKVDWLDTAKIQNTGWFGPVEEVVKELKEDILKNGRHIYIKEDKNVRPV